MSKNEYKKNMVYNYRRSFGKENKIYIIDEKKNGNKHVFTIYSEQIKIKKTIESGKDAVIQYFSVNTGKEILFDPNIHFVNRQALLSKLTRMLRKIDKFEIIGSI